MAPTSKRLGSHNAGHGHFVDWIPTLMKGHLFLKDFGFSYTRAMLL
jgi:hypothetical protein